MLYISTDYCRLLIKFKQELKALAEAFARNFPTILLMTTLLSTYVDLSQRCSKAILLQCPIKVDSDTLNDAFFISLYNLHKAIHFLDLRKAKDHPIFNQLPILISEQIIYGPFE